MEGVLKDHKKPKNAEFLRMAFGSDWKTQLVTIDAGVEMLRTSEIEVFPKEPHPGTPHMVSLHKFSKVRIGFSSLLYQDQDPRNRDLRKNLATEQRDDYLARGLLRLSASILLHASDFFQKAGESFAPSKLSDGHTHNGILKLPTAFKNLREQGGAATCVKILDSWVLFGHLAVHGNVDFYEHPKSLWSLNAQKTTAGWG